MAPSRALTRPVAALISLRLPSSTPRRTLSAVSRARVVPAQACLNAHTFVYSPLSCRRLSSVSSPSPSPSPSPSSPEPPDYLSEGELAIFNKLKAQLDPTSLEVQDVSGGCGSMYALSIESPKFKGLTVIKQHKLVNEILAEDIKKWHGVQMRTKAT